MKRRLLVQILVLCIVFSVMPTVRASSGGIPYPYIKDIPNSGQISAAKTLTVIATSNDLRITDMTLKAINVDNKKKDTLETSGVLQVSQSSKGCYEYKQDFILTGDLKITGGKWTFEVISTYKPVTGSSEAKNSIRTLPSSYEKERWYCYYTIVDGVPGTTPNTAPSSVPNTAPNTGPNTGPSTGPSTGPDTVPTRYYTIPTGLTLHPTDVYNAGDLAAVVNGGILVEPSICVVDSSGAPVTTGPVPTETAAICAANGNGAWGISGTTTQPFVNLDGGGIRASFPNLRPYTRTGEAFRNARVKFTVGAEPVRDGGEAVFNIPGARVAASNSVTRDGENIELRITEAKDLEYAPLTGSRGITVTDTTGGADQPIFEGDIVFTNGAATVQLTGFTEETLGKRRLDVNIDGIFQTLRVVLTVDSARNAGGFNGSESNSGNTVFPPVQPITKRTFMDISESYWAETEIGWAAENGIMGGFDDETFRPDNQVTRQQAWMVLGRMAGVSPASMAGARRWAVEHGISDGAAPSGYLTRQQLVTLLYRYARMHGYSFSGSADITAYSDNASVAYYAKEAMAWAVGNGIISGTSDGRLNPSGTAVRAQFAVILYRFTQKVTG